MVTTGQVTNSGNILVKILPPHSFHIQFNRSLRREYLVISTEGKNIKKLAGHLGNFV
jgi:hypothetical protein